MIVEDGSGVTNSDSYVTRAEYIAYADTQGVTITDSDASDVQLVKAQEYIAHHEANLKGYKVDRDQSISYPRYDLTIEGFSWDSDEIPRQVILCQLAFALDINSGEDLYNRSLNENTAITKEKIDGAVEVTYASPDINNQKLSKSSKGDALLSSLLKNSGLMSIPTTRR